MICRNRDTKVIVGHPPLPVIARLTKSAPFCHCEECSDEAISVEGLFMMEIATPRQVGARNDKREGLRMTSAN